MRISEKISHVNEITGAELRAKLDRKDRLAVVQALAPEQFRQAHLAWRGEHPTRSGARVRARSCHLRIESPEPHRYARDHGGAAACLALPHRAGDGQRVSRSFQRQSSHGRIVLKVLCQSCRVGAQVCRMSQQARENVSQIGPATTIRVRRDAALSLSEIRCYSVDHDVPEFFFGSTFPVIAVLCDHVLKPGDLWRSEFQVAAAGPAAPDGVEIDWIQRQRVHIAQLRRFREATDLWHIRAVRQRSDMSNFVHERIRRRSSRPRGEDRQLVILRRQNLRERLTLFRDARARSH